MTGNWEFPADHTRLPSPGSVCLQIPSHPSSGSSSPKPGKEKSMGDKCFLPTLPNCPLPSMGSQTDQSRCPLQGPGPPQAQQHFINNSQPPLCSSDKEKGRVPASEAPEPRGEEGRGGGRREEGEGEGARAARAREGSREKAR